MRDLGKIGEQLLAILRQAIPAIAKRRVVIMAPNARIEADAVNDLACLQIARHGIAVQLIKKTNPHGQIAIGKEFDRFRLLRIREEQRHLARLRALQE